MKIKQHNKLKFLYSGLLESVYLYGFMWLLLREVEVGCVSGVTGYFSSYL